MCSNTTSLFVKNDAEVFETWRIRLFGNGATNNKSKAGHYTKGEKANYEG